jgi:hypothetical protein
MNSPCRYIFPLLGWSILAATAAANSDLATREKRQESIDQAMTLVQPVAPAPLPIDLKNPFVLSRDSKDSASTNQLSSDHEVLLAAAAHIVPTGVVQLDGSPIMLLGEKKLKVGDYLTITFAGNDYVVEIAAISHSSFTLRLNKEEITQPINP